MHPIHCSHPSIHRCVKCPVISFQIRERWLSCPGTDGCALACGDDARHLEQFWKRDLVDNAIEYSRKEGISCTRCIHNRLLLTSPVEHGSVRTDGYLFKAGCGGDSQLDGREKGTAVTLSAVILVGCWFPISNGGLSGTLSVMQTLLAEQSGSTHVVT